MKVAVAIHASCRPGGWLGSMEKMKTFENAKDGAMRYWETGRIFWNLLLVPAAVPLCWFATVIADRIGKPPAIGWPVVAPMYCLAAVGAIICHAIACLVEFRNQGAQAEAGHRKHGRPVLSVSDGFPGRKLALSGGASSEQTQKSV